MRLVLKSNSTLVLFAIVEPEAPKASGFVLHLFHQTEEVLFPPSTIFYTRGIPTNINRCTKPQKNMSDNITNSKDTRPVALLYKTDFTVEEIQPGNGRHFKLEEMQKYVGGLIEIIPLDGEGLEDKLLVVNEEGKLINLPFNYFATAEWEKYYGHTDYVSGDAIICHPKFIR